MTARAVLQAAGVAQIDVRVMDAERMEYPEGSFERVGCGFGLSHFPRPQVALRGVLHVLSPDGRAGFSVWDGFAPAIRVRFDDLLVELVPPIGTWASSPFEVAVGRLAERNCRPERMAELMRRAGFAGTEQRTHRFSADYVDAPTFVDATLARAERDLRQAGLGAQDRAEVRAALVADLGAYPRDAFVVRRAFVTLLGTRPGG